MSRSYKDSTYSKGKKPRKSKRRDRKRREKERKRRIQTDEWNDTR